jgi:hypothetical protein
LNCKPRILVIEHRPELEYYFDDQTLIDTASTDGSREITLPAAFAAHVALRIEPEPLLALVSHRSPTERPSSTT